MIDLRKKLYPGGDNRCDEIFYNIRGTLMLMKKKFLDVNNVVSTIVDRFDEFIGHGVSLQLISEKGGKLGRPAYLEGWIKNLTPLTADDIQFSVTFDWTDKLVLPGAVIVKKHHHHEFYLRSITLEKVLNHGRVHFDCNSWVYPTTSYDYDRVFFTNKVLKDGLSGLHVPYSYGFTIILLTVLVKAATFPLTKKQVESAMAMKSLQPQVKAIQQRYAGNQEKIQLETARLYKLASINPLDGCLPTLATVPIWIGLYRALSNVADEGLLTEGFFWIPSLTGPTTIAARQSGGGISWFPFIAYLTLCRMLVVVA